MFNEVLIPQIISGENCVLNNTSAFASFGKKCLVVTSKTSAVKSGALGDVTKALTEQGIVYTVFDEIKENPLASSVIKGGEEARRINADFVIGIGGGSPLDAAKAIAICAKNPDYDIEGLYKREIPSKALPVILVGTTSGTGSEVTGVSVLTNDNTKQKKSISGKDCYAALAFCDSKYTHSMNYDVTVSTALDAFAHASESFFSKKSTDISEKYAKEAIKLLFSGLKQLNETESLPDKNLREQLFKGSIYAGLALNITGACFPHTVGYILTEEYNIPHGKACTALFPCFFKRARQFKAEKHQEFVKLCGEDTDKIIDTISRLTNVKIDATDKHIQKHCSRFAGVEVKNFINSPGGFTKEESEKALKELVFLDIYL